MVDAQGTGLGVGPPAEAVAGRAYSAAMSDDVQFRLLRVPTAVWLYGFLRAATFLLPLSSGTGGLGIGLLLVPPLYVLLIRGSVRAWGALLVFDSLSFAVLVALPDVGGLPLLTPILAGVAIALLLLPSTRRYVTRPRRAVSE